MISKLKDLGVAFIRTSLVPPVGGYVLLKLTEWGFDVNEKSDTVYYLTFMFFSGLYYLIVHGIETLSRNPKVRKWAGIFLGSRKTPDYNSVPDDFKNLDKYGRVAYFKGREWVRADTVNQLDAEKLRARKAELGIKNAEA